MFVYNYIPSTYTRYMVKAPLIAFKMMSIMFAWYGGTFEIWKAKKVTAWIFSFYVILNHPEKPNVDGISLGQAAKHQLHEWQHNVYQIVYQVSKCVQNTY